MDAGVCRRLVDSRNRVQLRLTQPPQRTRALRPRGPRPPPRRDCQFGPHRHHCGARRRARRCPSPRRTGTRKEQETRKRTKQKTKQKTYDERARSCPPRTLRSLGAQIPFGAPATTRRENASISVIQFVAHTPRTRAPQPWNPEELIRESESMDAETPLRGRDWANARLVSHPAFRVGGEWRSETWDDITHLTPLYRALVAASAQGTPQAEMLARIASEGVLPEEEVFDGGDSACHPHDFALDTPTARTGGRRARRVRVRRRSRARLPSRPAGGWRQW